MAVRADAVDGRAVAQLPTQSPTDRLAIVVPEHLPAERLVVEVLVFHDLTC